MTPLLTTALFREFETTDVSDEALGILIESAEQSIELRAGAVGTVTDRRRGGLSMVFLSRHVGAIISVTERYGATNIVLDPADYTLLADGRTLRRELYGPHPASAWVAYWGDDVIAVYTAADDMAERQRVAVALVKLDLSHHPGLAGETIGTWSESYTSNATLDYTIERQAILASLTPAEAWFA